MRLEIRNRLGDITSELHERGYKDWSMSALGNQRRHKVSEAVKILMNLVISGNSPYFKVDMTHFPNMCRLIALYQALKNPDAFIELDDAKVENKICLIRYVNGNVIKYSKIGDDIFRLNNIGNPFQPLSFEVTYLYQK
ncbi:uncharacterized protein LOC126837689 [Adelges cooleyi]|nr:uncharacterized protein LOC126837689 [Adelges cooleyi]